MSNNRKILRHLLDTGSISPFEALMVHRIVRLAPRIHELRHKGVAIKTTTVTDQAGTPYTRYVLRPSISNRLTAIDLVE